MTLVIAVQCKNLDIRTKLKPKEDGEAWPEQRGWSLRLNDYKIPWKDRKYLSRVASHSL